MLLYSASSPLLLISDADSDNMPNTGGRMDGTGKWRRSKKRPCATTDWMGPNRDSTHERVQTRSGRGVYVPEKEDDFSFSLQYCTDYRPLIGQNFQRYARINTTAMRG